MKAFGIKFNNRTRTFDPYAGCPSKADAEFLAFAALCASERVAEYVSGVEFENNSDSYWVDVDPVHEFTEIGGAIDWVADKTLSQFVIFGRSEVKGGLNAPR